MSAGERRERDRNRCSWRERNGGSTCHQTGRVWRGRQTEDTHPPPLERFCRACAMRRGEAEHWQALDQWEREDLVYREWVEARKTTPLA